MKPIGQKTVYGGLGGLIIGGFLGGPVGAIVGLLAGGAGGNAFEPAEPAAPTASNVPGLPAGVNAGDLVLFDALNTADPQGLPLPPISSFLGQTKDVPLLAILSPADQARIMAIPALAPRASQPLSASGLVISRPTGIASPLPNSVVLALADPRVAQTGAIPSLASGIVFKLNDPPTTPVTPGPTPAIPGGVVVPTQQGNLTIGQGTFVLYDLRADPVTNGAASAAGIPNNPARVQVTSLSPMTGVLAEPSAPALNGAPIAINPLFIFSVTT